MDCIYCPVCASFMKALLSTLLWCRDSLLNLKMDYLRSIEWFHIYWIRIVAGLHEFGGCRYQKVSRKMLLPIIEWRTLKCVNIFPLAIILNARHHFSFDLVKNTLRPGFRLTLWNKLAIKLKLKLSIICCCSWKDAIWVLVLHSFLSYQRFGFCVRSKNLPLHFLEATIAK